MTSFILRDTATLDGYILASELERRCGISVGAHRYWDCLVGKYAGVSTVFIARDSVPARWRAVALECHDLSGLMSAQAFCQLVGISPSHLNPNNNSALFSALRIVRIEGVKFIDVASLYARLEIPRNARIYIDKCKRFAPSPYERKIKLTRTLCLGYY